MKYLLSIVLLVALLQALPVSKDQQLNNTYEIAFITGCTSDAGKKISIKQQLTACICTWQTISANYSTKELQFIDEQASTNSKEMKEFIKFTETATLNCLRQIP